MARTVGYHYVKSCYGLWLPGADRGSWSEAWDERIGFSDPHTLQEADPARARMARERMTHQPVRLDDPMISSVIEAIGRCAAESDWTVAAASVESTHTHMLLTYTQRKIDDTVKWIKDRATKAIHRATTHSGPVWCKGKWRSFVFDDDVWSNTRTYIERHNLRRCESAWPYSFIATS